MELRRCSISREKHKMSPCTGQAPDCVEAPVTGDRDSVVVFTELKL